MRILISGFEAFGGRSTNPTALLVRNIQEGKLRASEGLNIESILLPVTFEKAFHVLEEKIHSFKPDMVLSFGLASSRHEINLERVAINCLDAEIDDNNGHRPIDRPISEGGEAAYFSTLPLRQFESALKERNLPVKISNSAGTFVCNYLFYKLMESQNVPCAGFIHVPLQEILSQEKLLEAVSVILGECHEGLFV
ncbi:pyroglutamyl-peptidase I [Peredibacter sp. HCB2-198]|uniref:pyroglutamyl-peptidase I family protein n=1 Tax=Peredibacter sp. HCB2-198 TaxID=3383025 RepID=UPI0038B467DD